MVTTMRPRPAIKEDRWIPSNCSLCYACCSILVHRVNGVVVKIEGNPDSPTGSGRLCGKGVTGMMMLYDPNRIKTPLRRTNPEKGIGIDPKWEPISWDEALDIAAAELKKIKDDDPRRLFWQATTTCSTTARKAGLAFLTAFGSPNTWAAGGGLHCGNGAHLAGGVMHASWSVVPDFAHCEYAIYFGASKGHAAGHAGNAVAQQAADARARGMKLVVIDPMCNFSASKATEWVPIRVGTDGVLALSMLNVLLNELGIWDAPYLKTRTNGPYLIDPDGLYVRDPETKKPLIWDPVENRAQPFDDPSIKDFALLGDYDVSGVRCQPGFQLLKEHVKKYSPEMASEITTIPAATIRRLAQEWGEHARVGSTIEIDGKTLPYRPVSAVFFRGAQGHRNSTATVFAIDLLNQIVGAADVPGGTLGFNPTSYGHPETGKPYFVPKPCPDGLMITGTWHVPHYPYPPHEPTDPQTIGLLEAWPLAMFSPTVASEDQEEWWDKFHLPYRPGVLINYGANSIMSVGNPKTVAKSLKRYDFIISIDLFLNEFTDFADLVLPDTCYLERYDPLPNPAIFSHAPGPGQWGWAIGQPAVEPEYERRGYADFMIALAERLDMLDDLNAVFNLFYKLEGDQRLLPGHRYSWEEISDHILKNTFGPERGLEWFKEHGVITWPKRVEETYWRPFVEVRVPVYFEWFLKLGAQAKALAERHGVELDTSHYSALPEWSPCVAHEVKDPSFDLIGFYFRDTIHTNSLTQENPWLDEAALMNPYSYNITINRATGERKGLRDGDIVWIESVKGRRVKGKLKLSEAIHPEGLAVGGCCAGHWSLDQPIARGKGVFFNELLEVDLDHADPVNLNLDVCVKVRIYRAKEDE